MPTFIDESGDIGHEPDSETYYRLAGVWVPTTGDAEQFREDIRTLRHNFGLRSDYEFKFTSTNAETRTEFFRYAMTSKFRFSVCHIEKSDLHWQNAPKAGFFWAAATSIAVDIRPMLWLTEVTGKALRDRVFVDDNRDQDCLLAVDLAFGGLKSQKNPSGPMTRKSKFRDSCADEMLQLTDMVCGAVGNYTEGDKTWFQIISSRCLGMTCLP